MDPYFWWPPGGPQVAFWEGKPRTNMGRKEKLVVTTPDSASGGHKRCILRALRYTYRIKVMFSHFDLFKDAAHEALLNPRIPGLTQCIKPQ